MVSQALPIPTAANTATLREQQANALAMQQAATAIEKALRRAGLPYEVWIIAAEYADNYAKEAAALTKRMAANLTARLVAAGVESESSTCEPA